VFLPLLDVDARVVRLPKLPLPQLLRLPQVLHWSSFAEAAEHRPWGLGEPTLSQKGMFKSAGQSPLAWCTVHIKLHDLLLNNTMVSCQHPKEAYKLSPGSHVLITSRSSSARSCPRRPVLGRRMRYLGGSVSSAWGSASHSSIVAADVALPRDRLPQGPVKFQFTEEPQVLEVTLW
jgi:hypothetical protein